MRPTSRAEVRCETRHKAVHVQISRGMAKCQTEMRFVQVVADCLNLAKRIYRHDG